MITSLNNNGNENYTISLFNIVKFHCIYYEKIYFIDELSREKTATQSHTQKGSFLGENGAHYAVDGSTSTCTKTIDIGTSSTYKDVWWKVDLGEIKSIYSIGIQFKNYGNEGISIFSNSFTF